MEVCVRMVIGGKNFDLCNDFCIMGILNVTPDSFSDGGRTDWNNISAIIGRVESMISEGADIIDIGGQTTQIGYTEIDSNIEIRRVVPVIREIKKHFDIPVSIDTYRSNVAIEAIRAGADMVNDIWGLKYDDQMAHVVASSGVSYCLAHNSRRMPTSNFLGYIKTDLSTQINRAMDAGINTNKIIVDPGISLGKTCHQNLMLLNNLEVLLQLGYPVLLGVSRKNFMKNICDTSPSERIEMTIAANVVGALKGCTIFRVHDIKENKKALLMTRSIINSKFICGGELS